jgi:hypothetical protein
MDGIGDGTESMGFDMPMPMHQQPHFFASYRHDGYPVASIFSNTTFHDEPSIEMVNSNTVAKHRRIARVSRDASHAPKSSFSYWLTVVRGRPATCVGRRKPNMMARRLNAHIVPTTRRIMCLPRLRKSKILLKGMLAYLLCAWIPMLTFASR